MRRTDFGSMNCSVARTLEVVGEWWTMLVIREAFNGVRRFEEFQSRLGIARNVLATRLRSLVDHGIFERSRYQEHPPRYEYRLTPKGRDLYPVLVSMMCWGDRWEAGPNGPPVTLHHLACDHPAEPMLVCAGCGSELDPSEVRAAGIRPPRRFLQTSGQG